MQVTLKVHMSLPAELLEAIRERAAEEHRSMASLVRHAVLLYLGQDVTAESGERAE